MSPTVNDTTTSVLFGTNDDNVRAIEHAFDVRITSRNGEIQIAGEPEKVSVVERLIDHLQILEQRGVSIRPSSIRTAIRVLSDDPEADVVAFLAGDDLSPEVSRIVKPRTVLQRKYLEAIEKMDMTFSIGPAGTGKTFLAVAVAAAQLGEKKVRRIILCRPAVEAGEKLGFLPGDLAEKINPYLRPLYDSLYDILGFEKVGKLIEKNVIEVAPLAFMRGRTLSDAFIILDEAQNTTTEQMKMFLTRMGFGSKVVVTGDITQIDLPDGRRSGLREAWEMLEGVDGIEFIHFTQKDVVRHPLVGRIVHAYDVREARRNTADNAG